MNERRIVQTGIAAAVLLFAFRLTAYRISEWEQAIITQFGKPVGGAITKPGLHFKLPDPIQKTHRLDKRILNWDGFPNQIPTKDKKYIWVDTTARWRIKDPLLFIQTVRDEDGARSRLDGILDAVTRDVISGHNLVEAVRNSDRIIGVIAERNKAAEEMGEEPETSGSLEKIAVGREKISEMIIEKARKGLGEFGIEIIDVQMRRIAYEASVEAKVFDRMVSERQRIAERIRSFGKGERAKIMGKISRDLQEIQSKAYEKAEGIRGDGDGKAIRIYAGAMNSDPDFYEFLRTLEAYKKALPQDTRLILSTESKFLELLRKR